MVAKVFWEFVTVTIIILTIAGGIYAAVKIATAGI